MHIAITGSTGLVGTAVVARMRAAGHSVVRLVRSRTDAEDAARWDPSSGEVDLEALGDVDAVIHLAGENVAGGRWTAARKRRIHESRGPATARLCRTLATMPQPPKILISASATGIYGSRGDEELDEDSPVDAQGDFLAQVAREWEAGTAPLEAAGARVVKLRIGIVLARQGGALAKMLLPFRLGLGGRLGDGKHWMSWISLHDLTRVVAHALEDDGMSGPVLAVAPKPVTNTDYTRALGACLGRPTIFPIPRLGLRLMFGEFAEVLLGSQRARPSRLLAAGFTFEHAELHTALRHALDRN